MFKALICVTIGFTNVDQDFFQVGSIHLGGHVGIISRWTSWDHPQAPFRQARPPPLVAGA